MRIQKLDDSNEGACFMVQDGQRGSKRIKRIQQVEGALLGRLEALLKQQ